MASLETDWEYPGSRWWKFDFHVHTPASSDYGKGPNQCQLMKIEPSEWLLGFMTRGIDCVAVTDHNSGTWIDPLKEALLQLESDRHPDFRPLHLFPGIEISVNLGFHLLAIFDNSYSTSDIDTLIGSIGFRGTKGESDDVTQRSGKEVIDEIVAVGGIPVPAHTDQRKGLLRISDVEGSNRSVLDTDTLLQVINHPDVIAMEVADQHSAKPEIYRQKKISLTSVLGSDSHHPDCTTGPRCPGSHFTWVKMAEPSLEGLYLALLDGERFSIRRSDDSGEFDPFPKRQHLIESVKVSNARHMGGIAPVKFEFNPMLNTLIGGRGTGKSTMIHAIRLASRRVDELEHLEQTSVAYTSFDRFNKVPAFQWDIGGLLDETTIVWTVLRDGVRHRVYWGGETSDNVVEDQNAQGTWVMSPSQSVDSYRFPIRIFSQGQIADMAGDNRGALLNLIDDAAGVSVAKLGFEQSKDAYYSIKARIYELDHSIESREETLKIQLMDTERKLERFEKSGYADILTNYRNRSLQRAEIDSRFDGAKKAADEIANQTRRVKIEDLPDGLFDANLTDDLHALNAINGLTESVAEAHALANKAAETIRTAVQDQAEGLAKSNWEKAVENANIAYAQLITSIKEEGVDDPDQYGELVASKQKLDNELTNLDLEQRKRNKLLKSANVQQTRILRARRVISDYRRRFLFAEISNNKFVRINVLQYGDEPRQLERSLREILGLENGSFEDEILSADGQNGMITDLCARVNGRRGTSTEFENRLSTLKSRLELACQGEGSFHGRFINYMNNQFERNKTFLDRIMTWFPEDGLRVSYSRRGDGKGFVPIEQGSPGQKAAALLAFLLAHGEEPLVLDQPEDDLDNELIYGLVVRQIRENKLRRQIIIVTHNPNIVVNGDAELISTMDYVEDGCDIRRSGSLQDSLIREEICRVLEGGEEAFERRYKRLGQEVRRNI